MKLWEVHDKIEMILAQCVDKETGEIEEEAVEQLDGLEIERKDLAIDIARYLKGERAEADAISVEVGKLMKRANSHRSRAAWLEDYIGHHIGLGEDEIIKDATVKVHWKKSTAVKVLWPDEKEHEHVDPQYLTQKITVSVNKAKALPVLREGGDIRGLTIEHRIKLKVD